MKRFSIPLGVALAVLSLLAAGTPAHAGERPFRADLSGGLYYDGYSGSLGAIGFEATHLGKANFFGGVGSLDNSQIIYISGDFSAANGDRLFATSAVDFDMDTGIAIGTLTFTGGTGRFEDAAGSADVIFVLDPDLQSFYFLIDGSVDY